MPMIGIGETAGGNGGGWPLDNGALFLRTFLTKRPAFQSEERSANEVKFLKKGGSYAL